MPLGSTNIWLNEPTDADATRKVARFLVSPELLREVLMFPRDSRIVGVSFNHATQSWEMSVEGDALPDSCLVSSGCHVPLIRPHYKTEEGIASFAGWGADA